MAVDVTAFTADARKEFMDGKLAAEERVMPANFEVFTSKIPSTVRVETQTYMSNLPRLREFNGYVPFARLASSTYTIENKEYRTGLTVRKTDLDDDQVGGYLRSINALPALAQKDIGFRILDKLAAGTTDLCFDGSAFFAGSHTIGSGDNLDTFDGGAQDAATHYVIACICNNPVIKPVIFQDRESLSSLLTTADTPQAALLKEYEYWCDCRFGLGYGFWWDAIHMTITDTPTLSEVLSIIRQIINLFRTFTLPKGSDADTALYVHEGWVPSKEDFVLFTNMRLGELFDVVATQPLIAAGTSGATITNQYQNKFTVIPTSALGA